MEPLSSTLNSSRGFVSPQMLQVFITILRAFRKLWLDRARSKKRAHPITPNFGFQRSGLWACLAQRFKASMRIAMPFEAIDQRMRLQEEEAGV